MKTVSLYGSEQYIIAELLKRAIEERKRILDINSDPESMNELIKRIDDVRAQIALRDIEQLEALLRKTVGENDD